MSKYIIIDEEVIQKRIDELEKEKKKLNRFIDTTEYTTLDNLIKQLQNILSQSTPLIPEIEKAYIAGESSRYSRVGEAVLQHNYISNLKLDI